MSVLSGEYVIIANRGEQIIRDFTFYAGPDDTYPPFDFANSTASIEIVDPRRTVTIFSLPLTIAGNVVHFQKQFENEIEPGTYIYRLVITKSGSRKYYIRDKFIMNA
jgi:hypothetical protein